MKRTGPTNPYLRGLIIDLEIAARKNDAPIWKRVAELLSRSTRRRIEVNVGKIDRVSKEGDVVVVPGKVLGAGTIGKKVTVAAWRFTPAAKQKIEAAGGKAISIYELLRQNPKGSGVVIVA
ncbi:MAG: 50S ribosomal protein L18e [Candidatus Diapherotrites archaeon]|nr:50S ribosomal protein L18e [Candidatus Diapherotrites archaeon]